MGDRVRVLGGAALGLLLGVAIVLVVNVAYPAPSRPSFAALGSAQAGSVTSNATATTETTVYPAGAMNTPAYVSKTSTSTTAVYTQPTSPGVTAGVSTKQTARATGSIPTTLIDALPPIAIALVLGILVYQLSTRRVDSE